MSSLFFNITPLTPLPFSKSQSFAYQTEVDLDIGQLVEINFANRNILGVVVSSLTPPSPPCQGGNALAPLTGVRGGAFSLDPSKIKKINKVIDTIRLTSQQLELANFVANYYYTSLGSVLKLMVPPVMKRPRAVSPLTGGARGGKMIAAGAKKIINKPYLPYNANLTEKAKKLRTNQTKAEQTIWKILQNKQFLDFKFRRQKPINNFIVDFYCAELMLVIEIDGGSHGPKQKYDNNRTEILKKCVLEVIRYKDEEIMDGTEGVYQDLEKKIKERMQWVFNNPRTPPSPPCQGGMLVLTSEQQNAVQNIKDSQITIHLLHGVTGSGKTEIYLRLIEDAIKNNKQSIVLVPEISLTPQAIERYSERFGRDNIVVVHSNLSNSEKFLAWQKIRNNEVKIIIGPRSAVFSPVQDLAYVIIDEEHDSSYKQYDQNPRYHAREVAGKLAEIFQAKVVLGSATPSIDSYYRTLTPPSPPCQGGILLHKLTQRITGDQMPQVEVVDMRDEFKKRNFSIFSDLLQEKIKYYLDQKKQIILYLNRRGAATFVSCRDCGFVEKCPNCDLPLTYHLDKSNLICHHCAFTKDVSLQCPECRSAAFKYFGSGTQKVELELRKSFPSARILRMDRDTTQNRESHHHFYHQFKEHQYDILIGTQMITKGWDISTVGLVGVISADTTLNLPDFRASERTFQLITQVAGRTGRGQDIGEVILQTYSPDSFVMQAAARHDFDSFYNTEIMNRQSLEYPPFGRLIKLFHRNPDQQKAQKAAIELFDKLSSKLPEKIQIIGPSPSFIPRIRNNFLYQIIIKINDKEADITSFLNEIPKNWIIDIDPESLL